MARCYKHSLNPLTDTLFNESECEICIRSKVITEQEEKEALYDLITERFGESFSESIADKAIKLAQKYKADKIFSKEKHSHK